MFDIHFYRKFMELGVEGLKNTKDPILVFSMMELMRSQYPTVCNIETTNISGTKRKVEVMDMKLFEKIALQIVPWHKEELDDWQRIIEKYYKVGPKDKTDDAFSLYILPKVVILNGHKELSLDPHFAERIKLLDELNISSYENYNVINMSNISDSPLGFCKCPWSSMSILSNGDVVPCPYDINDELRLGNAKKDLLFDIWNSKPYTFFRRSHLVGICHSKCRKRCGLKLLRDVI